MNQIAVDFIKASEWVSYDPVSGLLIWKKHSGSIAEGYIAGTKKGNYLTVRIIGRSYYIHRIAWLLVTGHWPTGEIDHINRDGTDNRWINLRSVTGTQNQGNRAKPINNTSGARGVSKQGNKWRAYIKKNKRFIHLGTFSSVSDASNAYAKAATLHFGSDYFDRSVNG